MSAAWAVDTMHAMVLNEGKLQLQTLPLPKPQPGQVRIRVRDASVNPVDWKLAERAGPGSRSIPGRDLAGVIDAVGADSAPWQVGQAVIAVAPGGSYTEYALAPIHAVALKPAHMSFEEAAGIPVVGETAWRAMVVVAKVQRGQRVLIEGGAGGVGSSAVQIAKARGAYVIATASPAHNALLRSLGADEVIDYHDAHAEGAINNLDVVLNTVDIATGERSIAMLRKGGILVSVVGAPAAAPCAAAHIRCAITGPVTGEFLGAVSDLADHGQFHVNIERRLPLTQAAKSWELNRAGHTGGKIILEVSH
ncbi:MAG TPA: NADP-dependent oxidoreductase [Steroidobacteraceae bacterium]|nr:NADP-dependent oxidoreductase [Steroidobacteraceae bacterium]